MDFTIFLDIDGTLSTSIYDIDHAVTTYLSDLSAQGYMLVFVTGRSYTWSVKTLSFLKTPFILAVQNGAVIKAMPEEVMIKKSYISKEILKEVDRQVQDPYVVYTGEDNQFCCYYLHEMPAAEKKLLLERAERVGETWVGLNSYDELPVHSFPAIKFFGDIHGLQKIAAKLAHLEIFMPVIRDPLLKNRAVAQGTLTNKGDVIDIITNLYGKKKVIAAGDDMNDFEMLHKADIKLVIETAPKKIIQMADIVASSGPGIIEGLKKALLWTL